MAQTAKDAAVTTTTRINSRAPAPPPVNAAMRGALFEGLAGDYVKIVLTLSVVTLARGVDELVNAAMRGTLFEGLARDCVKIVPRLLS